jgi:hypothetical protein
MTLRILLLDVLVGIGISIAFGFFVEFVMIPSLNWLVEKIFIRK